MMPIANVHIWHADVQHIQLGAALAFLNSEELTRYHRLLSKDKAREFASARATLKLLLAHSRHISPADISLAVSQDGKPYDQQAPDIAFNLSHSCGQILIAISPDGQSLGVDIELIRDADYCALAERYFADEETAVIRNAAAEDRQLLFFRIWTRKEACVKACGTGIKLGLSTFAVNAAATAEIIRNSTRIDPQQNWCIADCSDNSYAAAIVCCGPAHLAHHNALDIWQQI